VVELTLQEDLANEHVLTNQGVPESSGVSRKLYYMIPLYRAPTPQ